MKALKKGIALVLSLVMALGMTVNAFATVDVSYWQNGEEGEPPTKIGETVTKDTLTEAFNDVQTHTNDGEYAFDSVQMDVSGTVSYDNPSGTTLPSVDYDLTIKGNGNSSSTIEFSASDKNYIVVEKGGNLLVEDITCTDTSWMSNVGFKAQDGGAITFDNVVIETAQETWMGAHLDILVEASEADASVTLKNTTAHNSNSISAVGEKASMTVDNSIMKTVGAENGATLTIKGDDTQIIEAPLRLNNVKEANIEGGTINGISVSYDDNYQPDRMPGENSEPAYSGPMTVNISGGTINKGEWCDPISVENEDNSENLKLNIEGGTFHNDDGVYDVQALINNEYITQDASTGAIVDNRVSAGTLGNDVTPVIAEDGSYGLTLTIGETPLVKGTDYDVTVTEHEDGSKTMTVSGAAIKGELTIEIPAPEPEPELEPEPEPEPQPVYFVIDYTPPARQTDEQQETLTIEDDATPLAALRWAVAAGIIYGVGEDRLDPNATLPQWQLDLIMERFEALVESLDAESGAEPDAA